MWVLETKLRYFREQQVLNCLDISAVPHFLGLCLVLFLFSKMSYVPQQAAFEIMIKQSRQALFYYYYCFYVH